ncbi:hypothetical protein ACJ4V0_04390 [Phreatobacter sp. HK31-P]
MALILKVVAAVLTAIGAATLYWGTSPSLLSLGNTVMIVGSVIGAGGIVLFGLAAVLGQLQVLGAKLDGLQGMAVGPTDVPAPAAVAEPLHGEPFGAGTLHAEPMHSGPHAPIAAPLVEPDLRPAPEPVLAPLPTQAPEPAAAVPPTRRSFGLPPLATQAPVAAGAAVAGLAAGTFAAAAAPALSADKTADRAPPVEPVAALEPPAVTPVMPAIVTPEAEREKDAERDKDREREKDVERAEDIFGDAKDAAPEDFKAMHASPELDHAVEDLKDEVRAAEVDLAASQEQAGDDGGDGPVDHLASLERLLLGASEGDARAPAEPEPLEREHVSSEELELKFTDAEPLEPEPSAPEMVKTATSEPVATPPGLDTDDFMARLRETISRPVAPPAPLPDFPAEMPKAGFRPEPPAAEPAPPMSIEEELERALKASLEAPQPDPVKPVYVEPPKPAEPAPFLRPLPPEPLKAPAYAPEPVADREPDRRDDPMAALARDFPELNDILSPKKPAADPAGSLIDDLKDIFEPVARPGGRQEPTFAAPAFAEPAPPPSTPKPPLLREGVIATIPFRLYGDGTIEADLPEGTTQFASLRDFRAHVGG